MPHYFYLHNERVFLHQFQPGLTQSFLRRSWLPLLSLVKQLAPLPADSLLARASQNAPFERGHWQVIVGELLVLAAAEVPRVDIDTAALTVLLHHPDQAMPARADCAPIHQILLGSRDLRFGPAFYRPDCAGWNNADDVRRLWTWLEGVDPQTWTAAALADLVADDQERHDVLADVRAWPELLDCYRRAADHGWLVIGEAPSCPW